MRNAGYKKGFTLVELLIALSVSSLILTAVATLAFAMSSANKTTDDTSQKQAQVRFATLRISELIRHCKLICCATNEDLAIWRADDNEDGQINIGELVYIECGPAQDHLQLCEFPSLDNSAIDLSAIGALATNWWSANSNDVNYTRLLPQCGDVQFSLDNPDSPPNSRLVSISFDITENKSVHQYQIDSALRSWAGNLLNDTGDSLRNDDD